MNTSVPPRRQVDTPLWLVSCMAVLACACSRSKAPADTATVVDDIAMGDESRGDDWLAFGRTDTERRFSPLDQVNSKNVSELKVDWHPDLPKDRGLVSTPLVVDGILYFVGSMNRIRAGW